MVGPSPAVGTMPALAGSPSDEAICRRVVSGETALFEVLMRRHNQRVYRAVRSLVRNEAEIEDVMQQAYLAAYAHLRQFSGAASFATWLVRIAVNEALGRLRRASRFVSVATDADAAGLPAATEPDPEDRMASREMVRLLEAAVDELPETYRTVFMLREVVSMSTTETAEALSLSEDVVKTRLSRAKAIIRRQLYRAAGHQAPEAFVFLAPRCNRVVAAVLEQIGASISR